MSLDTRGLSWQEKAKSDSVCDIYIQKIIDDVPDNYAQNIYGRVFPDSTWSLTAFAVADQKTLYIPNWFKKCFELYEFEWIVFHEVGHIIYNHKFEHPRYEEDCADKYAVQLQGRIGFGICTLMKMSKRIMILNREKTLYFDGGELQRRINRLKRLGLPW